MLLNSCHASCPAACVAQGELGLLQRFGRFQRVVHPGCTCLCVGIEGITLLDMRLQSLLCTSDSKTEDNVTVSVSTQVQFKVQYDNVYAAAFTIGEPEVLIKALVDDVVRSELPKLSLDQAYAEKAHMVEQIKKACHEGMAHYGYEICSVLMTDLRPDASVLKAMNEINAARRLREAAIDKAEAEKILAVKAGEADAETKYLSGVGVARMRSAITDGFNESINKMSENKMTPQEIVNMMLVTQYLDVLSVFATNGKASVVIPHGLGVPGDMQSAVRDGMFQAQQMGSE